VTGLWQDLRGAVRAVVGMRAAGVVAILTLAAGIGASTTMFGVVDAMLLRPVPFDDPDALVTLSLTRTTARDGVARLRFSYHEFTGLAARAAAFERLAAFSRTSTVAIDVPEPTQVDGEIVSPGYLDVLRVRPILGRTFDAVEASSGPRPIAMIGADLWRDRLGADPAVIGRALTVDGVRLTIVGVLPASFAGLSERAQIWLPAEMAPRLTYAEYLTTPQHFITVIGRLKPDVSLARANAELAVLGPAIANPDRPDADPSATFGAMAIRVNDARRRPAAERSAWLLTAAIACVLLIACANVTSLLLARLHDRQREIAIRKALGGGTARVLRQLVIEGAIVAAAGGAIGLEIAVIGTRLVALTAPTWLPSRATGAVQISSFARPGVDGGVTLFAAAVAAGLSVLFAIAAGWDARGTALVDTLRDDRRTGTGRRLRALRAIVAAEVATAIVLSTGAALLVESVGGLERLRVGFEPRGVLTFRVAPPAARYQPADGPVVLERLLTSLQHAPGVAVAAVNRCTPLSASCSYSSLHLPGRADAPDVERHYISPDYFRALGIPLVAGRVFTNQDREGRPGVAVVSAATARRVWPGQNPIGQRMWFGSTTGFSDEAHAVEVVGVVGDVKYGPPADPVLPDVYTSYLQFSYPDSMMVVRATPGHERDLAASVRRAVMAVDPELPIFEVMSLDDRIADGWSVFRYNAWALGLVAMVALLLATAGVYGLSSFAVSTRAREMGIRLAIGATASGLVRLVLRDAIALAIAGSAVGLGLALVLTRLMRSALFDTAPADPRALAASAAAMGVAVLAGAWIPARRAGQADPAGLLRSDAGIPASSARPRSSL